MFGKDDIHPEVKNIRKVMEDVLRGIVDEKLSDVNSRIDALNQMMDTIKAGLGNVNETASKNVASINRLEKQRKNIEDIQKRAEKEMGDLMKRAAEMENIQKSIKSLKVDSISNDVALLKKRVQWLESSIASMDVQSIHSSLQKLENDIANLKMSLPTVIE